MASPAPVLTPLLTAAQAFPAFEELFLSARDRIRLSFRIFDPETRLRSDAARAIGVDWFDLIAHTLGRGVRLHIVIADFDPVAAPDYHARAHRCVRQILAAGEVSGRSDLLDVRASLHPSKIGLLPTLALWPKARGRLLRAVAELNAKNPAARARALGDMPLLRPYLREVQGDAVKLRGLRRPRLTPATLHQKLAVADGEVLYIGGLDLDNRRWDTPAHDQAAADTWHDTQLLVRGPVAAAAEQHLTEVRAVTTGATDPSKTPGLLRTISRARTRPILRMSPRSVVTELADHHRAQIDHARDVVYLESQFFRETRLARQIAARARANPNFGLILILPAAPDDVAFDDNSGEDARYGEYLQAKCVRILMDGLGDRLFIGSPAQPRPVSDDSRASLYGAPLIYLHAKVSIFSDTSALVSSANLNGRSFAWDTEAGVTMTDADDVWHLRRMCYAHWLSGDTGADVDPAFVNPATAVDAWRTRARSNARRAPAVRDGYILPYASGPARRFGRNLPGIPEEMV